MADHGQETWTTNQQEVKSRASGVKYVGLKGVLHVRCPQPKLGDRLGVIFGHPRTSVQWSTVTSNHLKQLRANEGWLFSIMIHVVRPPMKSPVEMCHRFLGLSGNGSKGG
jgi:hypothetical protein